MPSAILIHPAVWPQVTWAENWGEGLCSLFGERRAESPSNTKLPGPTPSSIPSGILIHPAIWRKQIWAENWGLCPALGEGELGPHLKQCGQGQGLPACQVSSWSIQLFGHNTPTLQTDRTGQTGRRSDSIGRTVLQTVAQNHRLMASKTEPSAIHCV